MTEIVDARAAAGMWDTRFFQISPEVPVDICQWHRLAGTYHKEVLILRRRRMYLSFHFQASGSEQGMERDDTVFVVFGFTYSDIALIKVEVPDPGQAEF